MQGKIGALLVYDVNPAYDYSDAEKFKTGLTKVKTTVSFHGRLDETTELCKYVLPAPHFLESWGDAEPKTGYISLDAADHCSAFQNKVFRRFIAELDWQ